MLTNVDDSIWSIHYWPSLRVEFKTYDGEIHLNPFNHRFNGSKFPYNPILSLANAYNFTSLVPFMIAMSVWSKDSMKENCSVCITFQERKFANRTSKYKQQYYQYLSGLLTVSLSLLRTTKVTGKTLHSVFTLFSLFFARVTSPRESCDHIRRTKRTGHKKIFQTNHLRLFWLLPYTQKFWKFRSECKW